MRNLIKDLLHFHMACDVDEFTDLSSVPPEIRELRMNLLEEEFQEYKDAEANDDEIWVADALADMIYIAIWTARVYGIPLDKVWAEVQRANMDKIDKDTWKVRKRGDWKVLKPEWWKAPDVKWAIVNFRKTPANDEEDLWLKKAA